MTMATELELAREAMLDVTAALMVVKPADELSRTLLERAIGTLGRREQAIARELRPAPSKTCQRAELARSLPLSAELRAN